MRYSKNQLKLKELFLNYVFERALIINTLLSKHINNFSNEKKFDESLKEFAMILKEELKKNSLIEKEVITEITIEETYETARRLIYPILKKDTRSSKYIDYIHSFDEFKLEKYFYYEFFFWGISYKIKLDYSIENSVKIITNYNCEHLYSELKLLIKRLGSDFDKTKVFKEILNNHNHSIQENYLLSEKEKINKAENEMEIVFRKYLVDRLNKNIELKKEIENIK